MVHWLNLEQEWFWLKTWSLLLWESSLAAQLSSGRIGLRFWRTFLLWPSQPPLFQPKHLPDTSWLLNYLLWDTNIRKSIPGGHIIICFWFCWFVCLFFKGSLVEILSSINSFLGVCCGFFFLSGQGCYSSLLVTQMFCTACSDRPWDHPVQPFLNQQG